MVAGVFKCRRVVEATATCVISLNFPPDRINYLIIFGPNDAEYRRSEPSQCDGNEKQHNAYQAIYNQIKCGHTKLHNEQKNEVIRILFVHKNVRNGKIK